MPAILTSGLMPTRILERQLVKALLFGFGVRQKLPDRFEQFGFWLLLRLHGASPCGWEAAGMGPRWRWETGGRHGQTQAPSRETVPAGHGGRRLASAAGDAPPDCSHRHQCEACAANRPGECGRYATGSGQRRVEGRTNRWRRGATSRCIKTTLRPGRRRSSGRAGGAMVR
jgi:hypothetical protein